MEVNMFACLIMQKQKTKKPTDPNKDCYRGFKFANPSDPLCPV